MDFRTYNVHCYPPRFGNEAQGPLGDNRKIFRYSNGDRTRDPKITCPSALPLVLAEMFKGGFLNMLQIKYFNHSHPYRFTFQVVRNF